MVHDTLKKRAKEVRSDLTGSAVFRAVTFSCKVLCGMDIGAKAKCSVSVSTWSLFFLAKPERINCALRPKDVRERTEPWKRPTCKSQPHLYPLLSACSKLNCLTGHSFKFPPPLQVSCYRSLLSILVGKLWLFHPKSSNKQHLLFTSIWSYLKYLKGQV
jgi:hypothetical protein